MTQYRLLTACHIVTCQNNHIGRELWGNDLKYLQKSSYEIAPSKVIRTQITLMKIDGLPCQLQTSLCKSVNFVQWAAFTIQNMYYIIMMKCKNKAHSLSLVGLFKIHIGTRTRYLQINSLWALSGTQTNYTLRLIICLLVSRNFPLPRSAWPIYFSTMNEW